MVVRKHFLDDILYYGSQKRLRKNPVLTILKSIRNKPRRTLLPAKS